MLEFYLLGDVAARLDGRRYEIGPARQRCVVAALLVDANQAVSLGQLAERVWAARRPQRCRDALYTYLSRLRRRLAGIQGVRLDRSSAGYLLTVDPVTVDLHRFRTLLSHAEVADGDRALQLLDEALGLWHGDAFGELDTPWLNGVRDTLAGQRLAAQLRRGDILLRRGGHARLLAELTARAAAHPLDERVSAQLMLALYRCGRQADALSHYLRLRHRLADALGVDPCPELQRLHVCILRADPALAAPATGPDPLAAAAADSATGGPARRAALHIAPALRDRGGAGRIAGMRPQTYDLHTHHYTPEFFEAVRDSGGEYSFTKDPTGRDIITLRGARFFGVTPAMTDLSARIAAMDEAGIDVAVLSLSTPNVFFLPPERQAPLARAMNDAYAEAMARHPDRIRAFASIPMDDPDAALEELRRAVGELRMNGVVLLSNIGGRQLTDPAYRPFLAEADRTGLCILLHPMIPAAGQESLREFVLGPIVAFPFDTTLAVARMCYAGVFRELPGIKWIIAHAGGAIPWLMERIDNGYRDFTENREHIDELPSHYLKRLYYDTVTFSPHTLSMLRDQFGADRMVMGSDFPHLLGAIDRAVPSITSLPIPESEKQQILGGTAQSILANLPTG